MDRIVNLRHRKRILNRSNNMKSKNIEGSKMILSLRTKLKILFIDYLFIICIISLLKSLLSIKLGFSYSLLFWLFIYIMYYVLPEYYFRCTLGMRLFKVSIKSKDLNNFKKRFLLYSVIVFFDRFVLIIFYIFGVLAFTDKKLLISEKYTGFRWINVSH